MRGLDPPSTLTRSRPRGSGTLLKRLPSVNCGSSPAMTTGYASARSPRRRREFQRHAVHAVAQAGRLRPVVKTWPRWPPQRWQETAVRVMPKVWSVGFINRVGSGAQKLGQPVPLSNLVFDENSGRSQPAQAKVPARCSFSSGLVNGRSVPSWRSTLYCVGVSSLRHSSSVWVTS